MISLLLFLCFLATDMYTYHVSVRQTRHFYTNIMDWTKIFFKILAAVVATTTTTVTWHFNNYSNSYLLQVPHYIQIKKITHDNLSTRSYRREQVVRYRYTAKSITFSHNSNVKYLSLSMHSWHFLPSFNIKQHSLRMQWRLSTCPVHCNLNGPSGAWRHLAPAKSTVRMAEEKNDVWIRKTN